MVNIVTLGSGRDKRRLFKTMDDKVPSKGVFGGQRNKEVLEGLLQESWVLGASTAGLSNDRLLKTFKGLQEERTLKSSTATRRDPGRTE